MADANADATTDAGRAVLLTGATGGVGLATVRSLADRGFRVYAAARHVGELPDLPGVRPLTLDVTDRDSVAAAAEAVRAQGDTRLHAVINNAGTIVQGPLELVPPAELERQFAVNLYGPALVTQAFLPFLREGAGRLLNVTAGTARLAIPFMGPISASKAALQSVSDALRVELAPFGVAVVMIEPGAMDTPIFAKAEDAAAKALAAAPPDQLARYQARLDALAALQARTRLAPPQRVADAIVKALTARRPKARYTVGGNVRMLGLLARLPLRTRDRLLVRATGLHRAPAAG